MNHFSSHPMLDAAILLVINFLIVVFSFKLVSVIQCLVLTVTLGYTCWKWYHDYKEKKAKKKK